MLVSFLLNCAIVIMVGFAFYAMFTGWYFMGKVGNLNDTGFAMFRFFTIDSNVLVGICSLIVAIAELSVIRGTSDALPAYIYGIKLMGSSAVMLTFVVTICFLMPQFEEPKNLFYNSNLFYHLIVPLVAGGSFVFTEHTDSLPFKATILGIVPIFFYAIFYLINVFTHLKDGKADKKYDFYNFLNGDVKRTPIAVVVILLVSYLLTVLLWCGNRAI